jgi:hypothetical protein
MYICMCASSVEQKLFHKTGAASYYIAGRVYYGALAIVDRITFASCKVWEKHA